MNYRTRVAAVAFCWSACWGCLSAETAPAEPAVTVAGLRVVSAAPEKALQAFDCRPGTSVALLVQSPAGGLVSFDRASSTLSRFVDEKGNDLLAPSKLKNLEWSGLSTVGRISSDGRACAVEVAASNLPAKGSSFLKLDGVITVQMAFGKKEVLVRAVALRDGSKLSADGLELTVQHVGKPETGSEPLTLALRASREFNELAEVQFLTADGRKIAARPSGNTLMGVLGSLIAERYFNLAEKADVADIKLIFWSDLQKKKLPFSLTIPAGL